MYFNYYPLIFLFLFISKILCQDEDHSSFYASKTINNEYSPLGVEFQRTKIEHNIGENDVNADSIIGPIMQPLAKVFNYIADNHHNEEYAKKLEEHEKGSMFDPESFLKALTGNNEPSTQPPSLMEKLFEPVIAPVKREMNRIKASTPGSIFQGLFTTPTPPVNSDGVRRAQPSPVAAIPKPIVSLFPDINRPETWFKYPPQVPPIPSIIPVKKDPEPLKLNEIVPPPPSLDGTSSPLKPLQLSDPFTVNPLMAAFTTQAPVTLPIFPELKGIPVHKPENLPVWRPLLPINDPFYNPLFPNRRNKLFDILTGGTP